MDNIDRRILSELQDNADLPMQELGDRVGLSHTPCWRRVKRLEERGIVKRRVALLDAEQLDLAVNVFVNVSLRRHQENALNRFETAVQDVPEVVECYSVSGETDFLLRVVVADVTALRAPGEGNARAPARSRQPDLDVRAAASEVHDSVAARLGARAQRRWLAASTSCERQSKMVLVGGCGTKAVRLETSRRPTEPPGHWQNRVQSNSSLPCKRMICWT